nr:MAG TPA: hypothetical protein [Bacteriophage sp.]
MDICSKIVEVHNLSLELFRQFLLYNLHKKVHGPIFLETIWRYVKLFLY